MNVKNFASKTPPVIKQRTIQVPIGSSSTSSHPSGITKQNRPRTLPVAKLLEKVIKEWYNEEPATHHRLAIHAQKHGVSLQEIERFDLTTLYGAHEEAVELLHANTALLSSPSPPLPPRQAGSHPPYDSNGEDGEMFFPVSSSQAPTPHLVVTLTVPPTALNPAPRRKAANRPSAPPGPPANAAYAMGTQPIPQAVQAVVNEIQARAARKTNKMGFPQRVDLRNMPSGMMDLDRRYGYIAAGSSLYGFYGDLRMFDERTWKYLVSDGKGNAD